MNKTSIPTGAVADIPNCGAVAIAAATGHDLDRVMAYFQATRPHQWRGRLCWTDLQKAIAHFGGRWTDVPNARGTLRKFVDQRCVQGRGVGYIARLGGHFIFTVDGDVVDQVQCAKADKHWARSKRVNLAARIDL